MTSQPTWPPPPVARNPLTEYDDLLTALVGAPAPDPPISSNPPMSRLRLVRELRQETGQDLGRCLAAVNDYCDRHSVFPLRRGPRLWLALLPPLFQVGLTVVLIVSQVVQGREIAAAPTRAARHLLMGERVHWDGVLLGLILVNVALSLLAVGAGRQRARREAEEARRKVCV